MSALEQAIDVASKLSLADRIALIESIRTGPTAPDAERAQLAKSIRGKYAHVPTSSEEFIRRKHEDLELEH